jgi:hypothetical protein
LVAVYALELELEGFEVDPEAEEAAALDPEPVPDPELEAPAPLDDDAYADHWVRPPLSSMDIAITRCSSSSSFRRISSSTAGGAGSCGVSNL